MAETPLHFRTITEISDVIASKQVSPVEITTAMLARIGEFDGQLKSYATVMADSAMAAAQKAEQEIDAGMSRGPLHGVPIAVKDLCFTKGVRTMGAAKVLADHVPSYDGTVIAKLEAAGAVLLGKLNLTEGAMGGYNPEFDIPKNPWNPTGGQVHRRAVPGSRQPQDYVSVRWVATQAVQFVSLRRHVELLG